jgi:undecaprenyl-diphosphatase
MVKENSRLILSLICLAVFFFLMMGIVISGSFQIDNLVNQKVSLLKNSFLDKVFIFTGSYLKCILVVTGILAIFSLYIGKRKKDSLVLAISLISGSVFEYIIKFIIQRPRPGMNLIQELGYSFPSGHSIFAAILFSSLIYFYKDKIKNKIMRIIFILVNILIILFIGFSRIYVRAHWFTDVIGGYAAGFLIMIVVLWIFKVKSQGEYP